MTNPTELDAVHKKLDDIARLQHVHGKRLDDGKKWLDISMGLQDVDAAVDRANSRLDLIEDAQNVLVAKLDEVIGLMREEH